MLEELQLDTEERLKAFTHPYRMKLIHVLREMSRPATATEVARSLGDGPGKVHYHMRLLEQAGIVVLVRTETVNGIIARYYEPAAARYRVQGASLGSEGDTHLRDEVARMITQRFKDGLKIFLERTTGQHTPSGVNSHPGGFLYDMPLHCTDEEWLELRTTLEQLSARFHDPRPGSSPRHLFIAGATDYSKTATADSSSATAGAGSVTESAEKLLTPETRWTFGFSVMDTSSRLRSTLPPL